MHVRAWRAAYAGILPDELLAALSVERRTASWRDLLARADQVTLLVEEGGSIAGFCSLSAGEVTALYVDPARWRHGLGGTLLREALTAAGEDRDPVVWVLRANEAAIRFYEQFGFVLDGAEKRVPVGPEGAQAEPLQVRLRLRRAAPGG